MKAAKLNERPPFSLMKQTDICRKRFRNYEVTAKKPRKSSWLGYIASTRMVSMFENAQKCVSNHR